MGLVSCRVMATRNQKVIALAAGNRHTAAIIEGGTVLAWGSNEHGQLGYGTTDSASNATPRVVEAMKVSTTLSRSLLPFVCWLCSALTRVQCIAWGAVCSIDWLFCIASQAACTALLMRVSPANLQTRTLCCTSSGKRSLICCICHASGPAAKTPAFPCWRRQSVLVQLCHGMIHKLQD